MSNILKGLGLIRFKKEKVNPPVSSPSGLIINQDRARKMYDTMVKDRDSLVKQASRYPLIVENDAVPFRRVMQFAKGVDDAISDLAVLMAKDPTRSQQRRLRVLQNSSIHEPYSTDNFDRAFSTYILDADTSGLSFREVTLVATVLDLKARLAKATSTDRRAAVQHTKDKEL